MKKQTDDVAGREQSTNRIVGGVEHLRLGINLQTAKSKRDAAGYRVSRPRSRILETSKSLAVSASAQERPDLVVIAEE